MHPQAIQDMVESRLSDAAAKFNTSVAVQKRYKRLRGDTIAIIEMAFTDPDTDVRMFAALLPAMLPELFDKESLGKLLKVYERRHAKLSKMHRNDTQEFIFGILTYITIPYLKNIL